MHYELLTIDESGVETLEGIFTSKKEIASYLNTRVTVVNDIIECNEEELSKKFHKYMITAVYTANEYQDDVNSVSMNEELGH